MKQTSQYSANRRLLALTAAAALIAPGLAAPVQAQGLFGRIGRALERVERQAADIETTAATLERSVNQVKQAADGVDRTADTAAAMLGRGDGGDVRSDPEMAVGSMSEAKEWTEDQTGMMPDPQASAGMDEPAPMMPEEPASSQLSMPRR